MIVIVLILMLLVIFLMLVGFYQYNDREVLAMIPKEALFTPEQRLKTPRFDWPFYKSTPFSFAPAPQAFPFNKR